MNLPLRARITAWYFMVLVVAFAALAWISDIGFQHSIETTVNDASRASLESIRRVLARSAPKGEQEVKGELNELAGLWADAALLDVSDAADHTIFQSPPFTKALPPLPPVDGAQVTFFTTNLDRLQYRIAMRVFETNGQTFRVRAAIPTEPFDQALDRFRIILQVTLPFLVILASLTGYWLSGRALAPVGEIIKTARGIGVQNLSARLAVPPANDELRRLSNTLNDMLGRIESAVNRIKQFTADASHDLRTPVALIRASAELALRRSRTEDEYRESLSHILASAEETTHLIENLLVLARADAGAADLHFESVELVSQLEKLAEEAGILTAAKGILFTKELPTHPVQISADPAAIGRLFLLILDNAVRYTPAGGRIELVLSNGAGNARIEIRDTGIGIDSKDLPHVFERFYRADQARSRESGGSGLGLAIALWIVEMHGGSIDAQSTLGSGTTFRISLPLATAS
jgi:two-component system, OmpR family, heavy metal sensor histidine kinase CusS